MHLDYGARGGAQSATSREARGCQPQDEDCVRLLGRDPLSRPANMAPDYVHLQSAVANWRHAEMGRRCGESVICRRIASTDAVQHSIPEVILPIWIHAPTVPLDEAKTITQLMQTGLMNSPNEDPLHLRVLSVLKETEDETNHTEWIDDRGERPPVLEIMLQRSEESPVFKMPTPHNTGMMNIPRGMSNTDIKDVLRRMLRPLKSIFEAEHVASVVSTKEHGAQQYNHDHHTHDPQLMEDVSKEISRSAKASPVYYLTFSLFTATGAPSSWDIEGVLRTHIQPLIDALAKTADISVATQIQLYSAFSPSVQPFQVEGSPGHYLSHDDLTAFVNAAEWPLSPSVGIGPTLNFVIYVPSTNQMPLGIEGGLGQSWLVPQWGGIHITNPELIPDSINGRPGLPTHLSAEALNTAFEGFASQLLSLLGVPSLSHEGTSVPLEMRLQAHQRLTGLNLHMRAASSLGSLARLAEHMSSIPIPKHVAQLVDSAMGNLTASSQALRSCRWADAVSHAGTAYQDSEKAFFDKSMVGQVYFPDEHKVAVYLPLLGPIGVPLAVGLIREIKRFVTKLRSS